MYGDGYRWEQLSELDRHLEGSQRRGGALGTRQSKGQLPQFERARVQPRAARDVGRAQSLGGEKFHAPLRLAIEVVDPGKGEAMRRVEDRNGQVDHGRKTEQPLGFPARAGLRDDETAGFVCVAYVAPQLERVDHHRVGTRGGRRLIPHLPLDPILEGVRVRQQLIAGSVLAQLVEYCRQLWLGVASRGPWLQACAC